MPRSATRSTYPNNRVRLLIWRVSLEMIRDHPWLGVGLGEYALSYQPYQGDLFARLEDPELYYPVYGETRRAHNEYLDLAASGGLPCLGLFLWLLLRYFRQGFRLLSSLEERGDRMLLVGSMAGVVALLTDSLVSFPLQLIPTAMVFWFYLGLPSSFGRQDGATPEFHPGLSPKGSGSRFLVPGFRVPAPRLELWSQRKHLFMVSSVTEGHERLLRKLGGGLSPAAAGAWVGIVGLALLVLTCRPLVGEAIKRDAYRLMGQGRWREVVLSARNGVRWDPLDSDLHLTLGAAYHRLGLYPRALEAYRRSFELYPNFEVAYNIGLIYTALGRHRQAEEHLRRAVRYKPTLWEGYQSLAELLRTQGRHEESLKYAGLARRFRSR